MASLLNYDFKLCNKQYIWENDYPQLNNFLNDLLNYKKSNFKSFEVLMILKNNSGTFHLKFITDH